MQAGEEPPVYSVNASRRPDHEFVPGSLEFIVPGNYCRLLDSRRTPGVLEAFLDDGAMFRWRILAFEHAGRYWDLPCEDIVRFQFNRDAERLDPREASRIKRRIAEVSKPLRIDARASEIERTNRSLTKRVSRARAWFRDSSEYFRETRRIDWTARTGPPQLAIDYQYYMDQQGLSILELKTADNYVLNPMSGEWFKGMLIVLAELGLTTYQGFAPRTSGIFVHPGSKELRTEYLLTRLACVRAIFHLLGKKEIVLYRGMSTEGKWGARRPNSVRSWSFRREVAEAHADFENDRSVRHAYLVKRTYSVNQLLMTYLETEAMNREYRESEAVVIQGYSDCSLF